MDDLDQREAFLKAIFDAPDDDLPRLVFADWLDERGESAWAELIRVGCELERLVPRHGNPLADADAITRAGKLTKQRNSLDHTLPRIPALTEQFVPNTSVYCSRSSRGFLTSQQPEGVEIRISADQLGDPSEFRKSTILNYPHWYSATALRVSGGLIAGSKPISTILNSPVTQKVTHLDLSGAEVPASASDYDSSDTDPRTGEFNLRDFTIRPTVTLQAVEALVSARECRRITHLDLRNNDLDNDAARAIIRSKHLIRLKSLHLREGNQLHGRTWAQLLERFGEEVVQ